jgi:ribulose-bisphosphate carboxylase small chain
MKAETFSYLPPMTRAQIAAQIRYALDRGLIPAVEFTSRPGPRDTYWSMWKLPLFEIDSTERVLGEVDACAGEHPDAWVRIVGYDPARGSVGTAFVVVHPDG